MFIIVLNIFIMDRMLTIELNGFGFNNIFYNSLFFGII